MHIISAAWERAKRMRILTRDVLTHLYYRGKYVCRMSFLPTPVFFKYTLYSEQILFVCALVCIINKSIDLYSKLQSSI